MENRVAVVWSWGLRGSLSGGAGGVGVNPRGREVVGVPAGQSEWWGGVGCWGVAGRGVHAASIRTGQARFNFSHYCCEILL
jgi:hypothetical protein